MLGNYGLRLVEAAPQVSYARNVLSYYETKNFEANRMSYCLKF
jgi:hypothetical protein